MKPTLLILAAGMGSRYGGLKQLDAMGPSGEVMLDYSVFDAIRAGFGKVVFVIRRDFEQLFKDQIGSRFASRIAVDYAFQDLNDLPEGFTVPEGRTKPWGTTHALLAAEKVVHEPFLMINADDFYGQDAYAKIAADLTTPRPADGKSLAQLQMRKRTGVNVIAAKRGAEVLTNIEPDRILAAADILVLLGPGDRMGDAGDLLRAP